MSYALDVEATVVIGAGTALLGAFLGSFGAPLLQGRLADRASLRQERMILYADAMLHVHLAADAVRSLVEPYRITTEGEVNQRREMRRVPDQITARMRLLAHKRVQEAWLDLLTAEDGLRHALDEDYAGIGHPSISGEVIPDDYPPMARLRAASEHFERICRDALHVPD